MQFSESSRVKRSTRAVRESLLFFSEAIVTNQNSRMTESIVIDPNGWHDAGRSMCADVARLVSHWASKWHTNDCFFLFRYFAMDAIFKVRLILCSIHSATESARACNLFGWRADDSVLLFLASTRIVRRKLQAQIPNCIQFMVELWIPKNKWCGARFHVNHVDRASCRAKNWRKKIKRRKPSKAFDRLANCKLKANRSVRYAVALALRKQELHMCCFGLAYLCAIGSEECNL